MRRLFHFRHNLQSSGKSSDRHSRSSQHFLQRICSTSAWPTQNDGHAEMPALNGFMCIHQQKQASPPTLQQRRLSTGSLFVPCLAGLKGRHGGDGQISIPAIDDEEPSSQDMTQLNRGEGRHAVQAGDLLRPTVKTGKRRRKGEDQLRAGASTSITQIEARNTLQRYHICAQR